MQTEIERDSEGTPVIHVASFRALMRTLGYFKYKLSGQVLFRGQTRFYKHHRAGFVASAYRDPHISPETDVPALLQDFWETFANIDDTPERRHTTEPLLQHYGIKTRWLDLVDSVPHALFFSTNNEVLAPDCHGQVSSPERRTYVASTGHWSYIFVLEFRDVASIGKGLYSYQSDGRLCDLRVAKQSLALRPHAQHGYLARAPAGTSDLWHHVAATIRFKTEDAKHWLGAGTCVSRDGLFPERLWDGVYGQLLGDAASAVFARHAKLGQVTKYDFHDTWEFTKARGRRY